MLLFYKPNVSINFFTLFFSSCVGSTILCSIDWLFVIFSCAEIPGVALSCPEYTFSLAAVKVTFIWISSPFSCIGILISLPSLYKNDPAKVSNIILVIVALLSAPSSHYLFPPLFY